MKSRSPGKQPAGFSAVTVILVSAGFLTLFANLSFFRHLLATFGWSRHTAPGLVSSAIVLLCATALLLLAVPGRRLLKAVLSALFLVAATSAYFMDTYGVIIDHGMLTNALMTDAAEVRDLLTPRFFAYILVLGLIPTAVLLRIRIRRTSVRRQLGARLLTGSVMGVLAVTLVVGSGGFFATLVREHKPLRYYANPLTPIYSTVRLVSANTKAPPGELRQVATDAHIPEHPDRELVVLVVGETARADRFSLNGYRRETNPELETHDVISFRNVTACGTSTAVSVPCMFAVETGADFDLDEADRSENVLDVLVRAGVNVIWRDNNSDSKGVAKRIPEQNFRTPETNTVCDEECRDIGMLAGLQAYIDSREDGDILIVLHQMGSHGPAYYKRYPAEWSNFVPECRDSQLAVCSAAELSNAYDNTIRYTDHFLGRVIDLLGANDDEFETVMMYIGDHGESLGENNVYLHGLPNWLAPETQTQVPMIFWMGSSYDDADPTALARLRDRPLSHDNLFHTLLGVFEVRSKVYDGSKDILQLSRELAPEAGARRSSA